MKRPLAALFIAAALSLVSFQEALACMAIGRRAPVAIAGEEALIVWDEANHLEHFVRRAFFRGAPTDFGFVVPSPTQPTLNAMEDRVFEHLLNIYQRPEANSRTEGDGFGGLRGGSAGGGAARPRVEVVAQETVAGLDATVLRANDAGALQGWLTRHGYHTTRAHDDWLAPYVAQGYYFTAFRFAPGRARADFASQAVRMTFHTDRPYYPYSEPQTGAAEGRPFRVSVMAPHRVSAVLERPGSGTRQPWSIAAGYAGQAYNLRVAVRSFMPWNDVPDANTWLTTFDDLASVRHGEDLFFERDTAQTAVPSTITFPMRFGGAARAPRAPRGARVLRPTLGGECVEMYSACDAGGTCTSARFALGCGEQGRIPDRARSFVFCDCR